MESGGEDLARQHLGGLPVSSLLPMKSVTPESSLLVRLRAVPFSNLALSVIFTFTVMMSPTCMARWSLKNAREPLRHSEFGL